MKHRASKRFWATYDNLPASVQKLADTNFQLLKRNPQHPSLQFKRVNEYWSVRVGLHYRALAVEIDGDIVWYWIGTHEQYDRLIR